MYISKHYRELSSVCNSLPELGGDGPRSVSLVESVNWCSPIPNFFEVEQTNLEKNDVYKSLEATPLLRGMCCLSKARIIRCLGCLHLLEKASGVIDDIIRGRSSHLYSMERRAKYPVVGFKLALIGVYFSNTIHTHLMY